MLTGSNTLHRLEIFHRRCARFLTGQSIHPHENGEWIYPQTEDVFRGARIESIESLIGKRKPNIYPVRAQQLLVPILQLNNLQLLPFSNARELLRNI